MTDVATPRIVPAAAPSAPGGEPPRATLHRLFEAQARRAPGAVAVSHRGREVTFGELEAAANRLAHRLGSLGVGPESRVGVSLDRSPELLVALLGIVKAGAAYVPLDPEYPEERLAYMRADAGVSALVVRGDVPPSLAGHAGPVVSLERDAEALAALPAEAPEGVFCDPDSLAYIVYTSGSTGRPKGVAIPHRGIVRIVAAPNFLALEPGDRSGQTATLSFDAATWEIWATLTTGATLVVFDREETLSPAVLARRVRAEGLTVFFLTTALFNQVATYAPETFAGLSAVVFGGEAGDPAAARRVLEVARPGRLLNMYGPAESTTYTTFHVVAEVLPGAATIPIGVPVSWTRVLVLDAALHPVGEGGEGEVYVGGHGLARGYAGRPALTAERFVPDAVSGEPGARLYRTGDIVRVLPGGVLDFAGRVDDQVKIRGFRIEPGEVAAALAAHPAVARAFVDTREDAPGQRRLVGYVVAKGDAPSSDELRGFLARSLPAHMVPSAYVVVDALPLTPNGKVDRRALPAPAADRSGIAGEYVAPRTETERAVARVWSEILGFEEVGAEDGFFTLGGHSLAATQVVSRLRETLGVELPLAAVLGPATVASVAAAADAAAAGGERAFPPILPAPRGGDLPVSFGQERVIFVTRLAPDNLSYHMQATLTFRGALEVAALEGALSEVVARHEVFRTTFHETDGRAVQRIHGPWAVHLPVTDFSGFPDDERKAAVDAWMAEELAGPMDLAQLPLVRWKLLKTGEDEHVLVHVEHHIIHDGWSFNLLLKEIVEHYRARVTGERPDVPGLPLQYADFCVWQRAWMKSDAAKAQLDFWRRKLGDSAPVLDLPLDRPRPPVQRFRGAAPRFELGGGLYRALIELAHAQGATLFQAMFAGFAAVMSRYAGQDDLNLGTGIAVRRQREVEGMIGMFVNSLVVRTDLAGEPSFRELVGRVREAALEAYARQDVPFDAVVEAVRPERHLGHNPLFQVMFSFHDSVQPELALPGVDVELLLGLSNRSAKFDMTVIAIPRAEQRARRGAGAEPDGITLIWEYDAELFDAATVERMFGHFRALLERAAAEPDAPVAALEILDGAERARLLEGFNDSWRDYPRGGTIASLLEAAVESDPDAAAVVFHGERTSYRALNERANRIAHHLRALGVGPETLVAVCMERTPDLVAALLGVLKAGGAYVPVDPAYPAERIAWMLEDARAPVVVTTELSAHALPETAARVVRVDGEAEGIAARPGTNPVPRAVPENLAYAIYTSGSTGRPKGVQIEHRAAVTLLRWLPEMVPDDELSGVLAGTSVSFDVSVAEIFGTLARGGTVHLVENALALAEMASAGEIRRASMVPSAAAELLRMGKVPPTLRSLGLGGEPVPPALVEGLHALGTLERIENLYGPTEDTTYSTVWRVPAGAPKIRVGRPVANTRAYVLDRSFRLVPQGAAGELYLAGAKLARGYGRRPALTAERWLPDPFGPAGSRMYRVGDRVRWTPEGELEYLGRLDHQVKVRGFRVEPGEIEGALLGHPSVEAAAVVARPDAAGAARLVAYVVAKPGAAPETAALREHLRGRLPDYMVPSLFGWLDALPRTPNGKVDRRALPAPDTLESDAGADFVPPSTETEAAVAGIWADVLGVERVGAADNFFELGGHSLLAMQVLTRLRERFGVDLPLRAAFEGQTVDALARRVDERLEGGGDAMDALVDQLDTLSDDELSLLLGDLR